MLGLGILDYIKIGIVTILVIVCGYLVWNYKHMQTTIADLKDQNATLFLGQEVILDAQAKTKETRQKVQVIVRKVQNENAQVQQEEATGNDAALDARLEQFYGVRGESKGDTASGERGSSPGHATP